MYDLIANVTHESVAGTTRDKENTVWKAHLRAASGGGEGEKWFQIQDLIVEETRKEMIFLGETVLQVGHFPMPFCDVLIGSLYFCRFGNGDRVRQSQVAARWKLTACSLADCMVLSLIECYLTERLSKKPCHC